MNQQAISPSHLDRQALIYVRQSSLLQVEQHQESRARQYQLVERAQHLGWPATQCQIIDEDQGLSAAHSHNRPGYQRLIAQVALREVGIILGLDVSRLARNSLDWYHLLELAAAFDVLIGDEDGIYDPSAFNDRLLLGLKGTISEVELYQIRCRLVRGQQHKAQRGELALGLPVGLEYDPLTQEITLAVDQSVHDTIALVFERFRHLRSVRAVLHAFVRDGLPLPYQERYHGGRTIAWRPVSYDALYLFLTNPTYAGVYCYGRRQRAYDPLNQQHSVRRRAQEDWQVFLPDHHPGYIALAEYEQNQQLLEANRMNSPHGPHAPGRGATLVQGLVRCQHCGSRMRVRYESASPYYLCDGAHRRFGGPICNRASARRVDALVEELLLTVINDRTLQQSLAQAERVQEEAERVERGWREQVQRAEYQADLARRRYEAVDPANRLVAQALETAWNERLVELEAARTAYETHRATPEQLASTLAEVQEVVSHFQAYWYSPELAAQDKKEIVRCLIEEVRLENQGKTLQAVVRWQGGVETVLAVPKYLTSSPTLYHRIADLAGTHTHQEIAMLLNDEGLTTVTGRPWTIRRVMDFRHSNGIASGFTNRAALRLAESGFVTSAEAAEQLGVSQTTIQKWRRWGIVTGKQHADQAQLWIQWTSEVAERLMGQAVPDPRMVSIKRLCRTLHQSAVEVMRWATSQGHAVYRLHRGTTWRFYILPHEAEEPATATRS